MKKSITLLISVLLTATIWAQSPEKMSYQAVIRDNSNDLVTKVTVGMKISILQGSADGTVVYEETQLPETNANGLVSIEIGAGTTIDDFSAIDWSNNPYFLKTETDPDGGTNYTIIGTSQLLSVPYALFSKSAGNVFSGNYNDLANQPVLFDGTWESLTSKPSFTTVATSGSYTDLINTPTILNSQWTTSGSDIYYNSGNVGIGTSSPATYIHAHGSPVGSRGQLSLSAPSGEGIFLSLYDADIFKAYLWYDVDDEDLRLQNFTAGDLNLNPYGGNVGIGTDNPSTTLEVDGQVRITGGTPAEGEVLTSDGTGLASWEPPANPSEDQIYFEVKLDVSRAWGAVGGNTIDFNTGSSVLENQGDAFNVSTSRFTAPENGIYSFDGVILFTGLDPGTEISAYLLAGGRNYRGSVMYNTAVLQGVSVSLTLFLSEGQTAELRGFCIDSEAILYGIAQSNYAYTYFTGAKVN